MMDVSKCIWRKVQNNDYSCSNCRDYSCNSRDESPKQMGGSQSSEKSSRFEDAYWGNQNESKYPIMR